jgi:hypothetical protein
MSDQPSPAQRAADLLGVNVQTAGTGGPPRPADLQRPPLEAGHQRQLESEQARKPKDRENDDEKDDDERPEKPKPISMEPPPGTRSHQTPEEAKKPPPRPVPAGP